MKKNLLIMLVIMAINVKTIKAQGMLNKSKDYIINAIKKDKGVSYDGNFVKDDQQGMSEISYTRIFHVKGFYSFQAQYYYDFETSDNICTNYNIAVPVAYLRYMMYHLKGYVQIDGSNFKSLDGKSYLAIERSGEQYIMKFRIKNQFD